MHYGGRDRSEDVREGGVMDPSGLLDGCTAGWRGSVQWALKRKDMACSFSLSSLLPKSNLFSNMTHLNCCDLNKHLKICQNRLRWDFILILACWIHFNYGVVESIPLVAACWGMLHRKCSNGNMPTNPTCWFLDIIHSCNKRFSTKFACTISSFQFGDIKWS